MRKTTAPKAHSIRLRVSEEEKQDIEEKARDRKLSVTEYLIRAGRGRATRQRADVDAIQQLMNCVEELKALHRTLQQVANGAGGAPIATETMEATMQTVCTAIQRVWNSGGNQ